MKIWIETNADGDVVRWSVSPVYPDEIEVETLPTGPMRREGHGLVSLERGPAPVAMRMPRRRFFARLTVTPATVATAIPEHTADAAHLLEAINRYVATLDQYDEIRMILDGVTVFERQHDDMGTLAGRLGVSDDDMDTIFEG